jgi:F0F1-type ATP synthase membrane subunit c/vacuolar-type H+-ATPase subunit K
MIGIAGVGVTIATAIITPAVIAAAAKASEAARRIASWLRVIL